MISIVLAFFAIISTDLCIGTPLSSQRSLLVRRRRDANATNILSSDFFCALQCGIDHSSAWSRVANIDQHSFENVSLTQVLGMASNGQGVLKDTFNNLCVIYESYSSCLRRCPSGLLTNNMRDGVTALGVLCDPQKSDYISQTPCIYNNQQSIQTLCQGVTDDLFAASSALQKLFESKEVGFAAKALPTIRQLCSTANKQANCILPAVQQRCGVQASDLLQSVLKASLGNLQAAIGDQWSQLSSPECLSFFHTMKNGLELKFAQSNVTATTQSSIVSTPTKSIFDGGNRTSALNDTDDMARVWNAGRFHDQPFDNGSSRVRLSLSYGFTVLYYLIYYWAKAALDFE